MSLRRTRIARIRGALYGALVGIGGEFRVQFWAQSKGNTKLYSLGAQGYTGEPRNHDNHDNSNPAVDLVYFSG